MRLILGLSTLLLVGFIVDSGCLHGEDSDLWARSDGEVVEISEDGLSAGQQRRVALARLWLSKQILWILDEPLTAIDNRHYFTILLINTGVKKVKKPCFLLIMIALSLFGPLFR